MPWETLPSKDGFYCVDWAVVGRMLRSYVRSRAVLANATVNTESHWIGPNLHTVDVDWDKVKTQTNQQAEGLLADFFRSAQFSGQNQISRLAHFVEITSHNNLKFQGMMRDAQHKTMENIDASVSRAETGIKVARFTRDASAEFLMVTASLVAVPVGIGAIAVGSGLKATARGQDDPKATKRTIAATFATEFVFAVVELGADAKLEELAKAAGDAAFKATASQLERKAAEKGMKLGLAILKNNAKLALEPTKAVLEGKSFQEGLITGGVKAIGGTHSEILKSMIEADERFPMVAAIADAVFEVTMDRAADSLSDANKGEKSERGEKEPPGLVKPVKDEHVILDALAYDRKLVQQTAIRKIAAAGPPIANPAVVFPHVRAAAGFNR